MPAGVTVVNVCDPSGMLPTDSCPAVVGEVFLVGNEPTSPDDLYHRIQVNRDTRRLATVFTPSELVEERVYLVTPPEALEWASQAGLPTIPQSYDVIAPPPAVSSSANLSAPAMFSSVKDLVTLRGSAGGEGFAYYRIQVGKGLNPQEWLQVGQEYTRPVTNSDLAEWDTSGLSGLYAVQLQVVYADSHVESAISLVTVDHQAPEVAILYPNEGEPVLAVGKLPVTLRAEVADDVGLWTVEFYMDGKRLDSLNSPPYSVLWMPSPGSHTLRVRAIDNAGNSAQDERVFSLQ
jgi:hypothetical protein